MVIVAIMIGREGSVGLPGKNVHPVLGRPLMEYPLMAALTSESVDEVYVSTDSQKIKEIGRKHGAHIIDRPPELCTSTALGEDAFVHAYNLIKGEMEGKKKSIEFVILLHCNAPAILSKTIDKAVLILRENPDYDSAVTVSKYNMWNPSRARRIGNDGLLHPFVPFEAFGNPKTLNCNRDSIGDAWFADMGVSVVRPRCLEHLKDGLLPQRWMGQKIYPLKQWGGLDVDYEMEFCQAEYWLKKHGFSEAQK